MPLITTLANGSARGYGGLLAAAGAASSYESIATSNPTSGTNITFSSIPSTYKHLQIRFAVKPASGNPSLNITYNGDTGSNYTVHTLRGNGSAASAAGATSRTNFPLSWYYGMVSTVQNVAIMDIIDYASTSKYKTARAFYGQDDNSGSISSNLELNSGLWLSTSAIDSITVTVTGGVAFSTGSSIALYGIKG